MVIFCGISITLNKHYAWPVHLMRMCAVAVFSLAFVPSVVAQDLESENRNSETNRSVLTPEAFAEQKQQLNELVLRLRDCVKRAKVAEFSYIASTSMEDSDTWHTAYEEAVAEGKKVKKEVLEIAYPLLLGAPEVDRELYDFGIMMMKMFYHEQQYERAYQTARRLDRVEPSDDTRLGILRAALLTNRFEIAAEYQDKAVSQVRNLPSLELSMLRSLPELIRIGKEEEKLRLQDEQSDLPHVKLETSEGEVIVELFEDQYPDTVGHFIFLVEAGFYDNLVFHRVTKNYLPFCIAQTGQFSLREMPGHAEKAWFSHDIGYTIHDEPPIDGVVRRHLRGALSLLLRQDNEGRRKPNSADGNFLFVLVPTPALDGNQVAFGRVISGMEFIDQIQPTTEIIEKDQKEKPLENPTFSTIIKAEVLRKRDREYKPNKVEN
jgi:cyclophilin family peptidyl-prolyl cis-trans isomerase